MVQKYLRDPSLVMSEYLLCPNAKHCTTQGTRSPIDTKNYTYLKIFYKLDHLFARNLRKIKICTRSTLFENHRKKQVCNILRYAFLKSEIVFKKKEL